MVFSLPPSLPPSLPCLSLFLASFSSSLPLFLTFLPPSPPPSPPGVAVIDNLVYAVGGSNRDDGTRSNLNSMERYNPERDEWEDMPPMHRSRGAASVTALNGCLYAVGGYDSGKWSPFA